MKQERITRQENLANFTRNKSANSSNSSDMKDLKDAMIAMANRPVNVGIDGEKVLKATTGKYSNTYGDEVGKKSLKI